MQKEVEFESLVSLMLLTKLLAFEAFDYVFFLCAFHKVLGGWV